ncbi:thioredoxin domain-containing protein [Microvirga flavescens]|uniref:thioredoxin domain-containing protein n=1 Tax=Microvirga flavescens TaxID=2249811 RepID=UPI000DDBC09F|nr:thioredoxin domain-containing protein [Microvirga flavescens]
MNRLAAASSPYLLQHSDNPVDWWEWGPEALAEARRLQRPVLLSIGYAACHWCHVMAHESFEDANVAAVMNAHFVSIKVDREERPDVDQIYMSALQVLGEQGGWPLTMFLTPDGEPFWGGTYFPKEPRFGRPGFVQVLQEIARLYQAEPERIDRNRLAITEALGKGLTPKAGESLSLTDLDRIGESIAGIIDPVHGGLKGAPKFPNPPILEFLARHARRRDDPAARAGFLLTLEQMAFGGIHDHLGGGFARYAVDEKWLVPHFEKMLYDNAQLLELYALAAAETGRPLFHAAAEGIVSWLTREMATPEGAFAASLDADSEGEEGRFYVWSLAEVEEVLGPDADLFTATYDITAAGNWEGVNIPNRLRSGEASPEEEARLAPLRARLLAHRDKRPRPALDDKVLADWNGLMIAALVRAALLLTKPDWIDVARRAYRFIAESMTREGRLGHSWRGGSLLFPGFALDHAAMMRAALALFEATGEEAYLTDARRWRDVLLNDYAEPTGLLAMTAKNADPLVVRPQPTHDDAVPNANGVFAEALVRLAQITGAEEDERRAIDTLTRLTGFARAAPLAHTSILNALDLHLRGLTVVVTGEGADDLRKAALALPYLDRSVCVSHDTLADTHPAKAGASGSHRAQALICAGMRCSLPVTDPDGLRVRVKEMLTPAAIH